MDGAAVRGKCDSEGGSIIAVGLEVQERAQAVCRLVASCLRLL